MNEDKEFQEKSKAAVDECFTRGFFEMVDAENFKVTQAGEDYLKSKAEDLYNASIALGKIDSSVPSEVGKQIVLQAWLETHNNKPAEAIHTLVFEVEKIGAKNFFELYSDKKPKFVN